MKPYGWGFTDFKKTGNYKILGGINGCKIK